MNFDLELFYGVLISVFVACYVCCFAAVRLNSLLQQFGYCGKNFLKWYFRKGNIQRKRISLLTLALLLLSALFSVCFSFLGSFWIHLVSAVPCLGILALYLYSEKKYALKVKANVSSRYLRLSVMHALLVFLLSAGVGILLALLSVKVNVTWFDILRFVPMTLLPLLLPFTVTAANGIMSLYEKPHNRRFVKRAQRELEKSPCVKVGITGSFGKTSVKRFSEQMLSEKFSVVATPSSFNTPLGIARAVLEQGLDCDIFIAEMGARRLGDISTLCDLVRPTVGVVTGVCAQHIASFGSIENIRKEKGVLARRVQTAVLGKTAADMPAERALREGVDFAMEHLVCRSEGTSFDLRIGEERVSIKTRLLGRAAAEDVALAAALCFTLGMTPREISLAAQSLEPVPHRLERLDANGVTILDDSYNSNINGAKSALEALRLFSGRKVVVTPGLVELGELEETLNEELGAALIGLDVILVGETLVLPLQKGYLSAGGEESRLRIVPTLKQAQELLSEELIEGDCVLFLNDLPDVYR